MERRDGGACAAVPKTAAMLVACAILVVTTAPAPAEPPANASLSPPIAAPGSSGPWAAYVAEAARRFTIPEIWILAVMAAESVNDPSALSSKGAIGLMQVMPATWDELRSKHGLGDDPWQPRANILAGTAYLRELHDRYGSVDAMLGAYNAGPSRYDEHLATGRALPAETVDYVAKIAPVIDGKIAVARTSGRHSPPSWSRAPLFAAQPDVRDLDGPGSAFPPSGGLPDAPAIVDLSALVPPSDGLFVQRPAGGGWRR